MGGEARRKVHARGCVTDHREHGFSLGNELGENFFVSFRVVKFEPVVFNEKHPVGSGFKGFREILHILS